MCASGCGMARGRAPRRSLLRPLPISVSLSVCLSDVCGGVMEERDYDAVVHSSTLLECKASDDALWNEQNTGPHIRRAHMVSF